MAVLWGVENLEGNIEDITGIPEADTSDTAEYTCYAHPELTITEREPKFLSPSKLPEVDVPQEDVTILADLECRIQPYRTDSQNEAAAGTCIHNIFAVFNPDLSHDENVVNATRICNGNNMYDVIPDPGKVVTSIRHLYAWLEKTYGHPCAVRHEVPFVHPVGGQVIHGEMDLLWYLSEGECVLIDFKNFPGDKATITTPGETNEHYAGKYAAQLRAYRDALTASGLQVRDTLLYYSVMGCVVRLT
jgi:ATP-dependent exoDNAse (exonuclease V) beta subunit